MLPSIELVKGIHPGLVLERELVAKGIKNSYLAKKVGVSPGFITDLIKQRRGINPALSIKLGETLKTDPAYFSLLQTFYEIKSEQTRFRSRPVVSFRSVLFWDISIDELDFERNKDFIIKRVFERGNEDEIKSLVEIYGHTQIIKTLRNAKNLLYSACEAATKYLNIDLQKSYVR